jgi:hypothetical protein
MHTHAAGLAGTLAREAAAALMKAGHWEIVGKKFKILREKDRGARVVRWLRCM